jgi:hypothetical protein
MLVKENGFQNGSQNFIADCESAVYVLHGVMGNFLSNTHRISLVFDRLSIRVNGPAVQLNCRVLKMFTEHSVARYRAQGWLRLPLSVLVVSKGNRKGFYLVPIRS